MFRNSDGRVYNGFINNDFVDRYRYLGDRITFVTRIYNEHIENGTFIERPNVEFVEVPNLNTLKSRLTQTRACAAIIEEQVKKADIVIARTPSFVARLAIRFARKYRKTCLVEVVGCVWDAYWNYSWKGKLVAPFAYFKMRNDVRRAEYALYVSESFLQKRYPCPNPFVCASNVVVGAADESTKEARFAKIRAFDRKNVAMATCAVTNVRYKGQHFVIRAIPKLNAAGIRVKYYCAGQGDQTFLRNVAKSCGVEDQVIFPGALNRDAVFNLLDECDFYLQPSMTEGLPRAVIEAMTRGCPCLGSKIGGIPELLPEECLFERGNVEHIAEKIVALLDSDLESYAKRNFEFAKRFEKDALNKRRNDYFERILRSVREKENL